MRSEALLAFKDYQRRLQEAGVPDYADIPEGI